MARVSSASSIKYGHRSSHCDKLKTIHDLPPELLGLVFRLGSEGIPYNLQAIPEGKRDRCIMPKHFPTDRHFVIKPFARRMSEVCSTWRKLVLSNRDLRLVIIGNSNPIRGLRGDAYDLNDWKKILEEVVSCDVHLHVTGLYGSTLGGVWAFIEDSVARLTSLRLEVFEGKELCAGKLFDSTMIKFPRLQHLDVTIRQFYGMQIDESERQTLAIDPNKFPSLQHLVMNATPSNYSSFSSSHQMISSLRSLGIYVSHNPLIRYFPEGLADILRANAKLQVFTLSGNYAMYPRQTHVIDSDGLFKLGSVETLALYLTTQGTCQFFTMCSFPVLKTLTLSVSPVTCDESLEFLHFPSLETLVFKPGRNDQTEILSYLQVPMLESFEYCNYQNGPCSPFSLAAPRLRHIDLSGDETSLNSCLYSLQQPHPTITSAAIRVCGDSKKIALMKNIDPNLFSHVRKLKLYSHRNHSPGFGHLYSSMANLQELELLDPVVRHANGLLPTLADGKHMFLPKLESVKCCADQHSYDHSRDPPLSYQHCSKLIALAEGQAKCGQRLKLICLVQPLSRRTRSRLENAVDKVFAPEGKRH